MMTRHLLCTAILCAAAFGLSGCLVVGAVDLAASTAFTVGKVAVKGTGALINAAIPDKDDEDKKSEKERKKQQKAAKKQTETAQQQTVPSPAPSSAAPAVPPSDEPPVSDPPATE